MLFRVKKVDEVDDIVYFETDLGHTELNPLSVYVNKNNGCIASYKKEHDLDKTFIFIISKKKSIDLLVQASNKIALDFENLLMSMP